MKYYHFLFKLSAVTALLVALGSTHAAEGEKSQPLPPTSPFIAQQQLSELIKQLDQVSSDISARESVVTRLKILHEKSRQNFQPKAMQDDVEQLTKMIEAQKMNKEGYVVPKEKLRFLENLVSRLTEDVMEAFPNLMELWRKPDPRTSTTEDQLMAESISGVQDAIWKIPATRYLDELRRNLYLDPSVQSITLPLKTASELRTHFDKNNFELLIQAVQTAITTEIGNHETKLTALRQKRVSLQDHQKQLNETIEEGQSQIDKKIIQWGLPALGLLLLGILAVPMLYKEKELQSTIFASGIVLDMFTVFLLTVTILLLGLGHRLSENVLGTLLGGISGYVLGRSNNKTPPTVPPPNKGV